MLASCQYMSLFLLALSSMAMVVFGNTCGFDHAMQTAYPFETFRCLIAAQSITDLNGPGICSVDVCRFIGTEYAPNTASLPDCTVGNSDLNLGVLVNRLSKCRVPRRIGGTRPCTVDDLASSGADSTEITQCMEAARATLKYKNFVTDVDSMAELCAVNACAKVKDPLAQNAPYCRYDLELVQSNNVKYKVIPADFFPFLQAICRQRGITPRRATRSPTPAPTPAPPAPTPAPPAPTPAPPAPTPAPPAPTPVPTSASTSSPRKGAGCYRRMRRRQ